MNVSDSLIKMHAELAAKAFADHVATVMLDQGMYRSWRCQKPGSWMHGFDITTTPGNLIVTGDVGDLVLTRTNDMIAWARGSIRDPHYFSSKVVRDIPTEEWSYAKSLEWINEEIADVEREEAEARADPDYDELDNREPCPRCGKSILADSTTGKLLQHDLVVGCPSKCSGSGEVVGRKFKLLELRDELETGGLNGEMSEHEFGMALYESSINDGCDWPDLKVYNSNFLWCREAIKWLLANMPEPYKPSPPSAARMRGRFGRTRRLKGRNRLSVVAF